MSDHRAAAEALLGAAADIGKYIKATADGIPAADMYTALQGAGVSGSMATAHALLAVEARLGQLVEQQSIANAMTGAGRMGVLDSDAELRPARDAVRRLLGLTVTPEQEGA